MAWIRATGGKQAPSFPFNVLDAAWDTKPNVGKSITTAGQTYWTMQEDTPVIDGNTLTVVLAKGGSYDAFLQISTDGGNNFTDYITPNTQPSATYTRDLSAYNGMKLRFRCRIATWGNAGTVTPVAGMFIIT